MYIALLFSSNITLPSLQSNAYTTFANGKFSNCPRDDEKPVALMNLPSINESTYACFPAQQLSAHESNPNLVPLKCSASVSVRCRNVSILYLDDVEEMILVVKDEIFLYP